MNQRLAVNLMAIETLAGGGFDDLLDAARRLDGLGVDELVVSDHVVINGYARDHREGFPFPVDVNWYEPLLTLAAVAAVTTRVTLGTNVLVAPMRAAVLLAKQVATLDQIAGGRVRLAVGVGWQEQEFDAGERPFVARNDYLVEQIEACRALWGCAPAHYHGRRVRFADLHSRPFPVQADRVPFLFGSRLGPRTVERIVRLGIGWAPAPMSAEEVRDGVALLRDAYAAAGRDPETLAVTAATDLPPFGTDAVAEGRPHPIGEVEALWDAGADTVIVHPFPYCKTLDDLEGFVAPLLEARRP